MKSILVAAALLLAANSASAQGAPEAKAKPKEIQGLGAPTADLENEKTIRKLYFIGSMLYV